MGTRAKKAKKRYLSFPPSSSGRLSVFRNSSFFRPDDPPHRPFPFLHWSLTVFPSWRPMEEKDGVGVGLLPTATKDILSSSPKRWRLGRRSTPSPYPSLRPHDSSLCFLLVDGREGVGEGTGLVSSSSFPVPSPSSWSVSSSFLDQEKRTERKERKRVYWPSTTAIFTISSFLFCCHSCG